MSSKSSNYVQRSSTFVHHVPDDLADRKGLTAQQFMDNERNKQEIQTKNWHAKSGKTSSGTIALRSEFSASRQTSHQAVVRKIALMGAAFAGTAGMVYLIVNYFHV